MAMPEYECIYTYVYIYTYIHRLILYSNVCTYIYLYIYTHTGHEWKALRGENDHGYVKYLMMRTIMIKTDFIEFHIYISINIYIYIYVYIYIYIYIYI
jgi:hypothetical protein